MSEGFNFLLNKEKEENVDNNVMQKMHRYWVLAGLKQSQASLKQDYDKKDVDAKEYNRQMHYLRKQIIFHYVKNVFLFPLWFIKLLTPSFFRGTPNIWTNLKLIFTKKEFHPLRLAMVSWFVFTYLLVQGGIFFFRNAPPVVAASNDFVQTSWSGGANTGVSGIHPTNKTNWNTFYSQSGMTAGATLALDTSTAGWSSRTDITTSTATNSQFPDIAVDSNGVSHVVYYQNNSIIYTNSNDWGVKKTLATNGSATAPPKIAVTPAGVVWVIYGVDNSNGSGSYEDVFYTNSTNANWTTWTTAATTTAGFTSANDDYALAVDSNNVVHIIALDVNGYTGARYVSSTQFSYITNLSTTRGGFGVDIAVDSANNIHAVWRDSTTVKYNKKTGFTWGTAVTAFDAGVAANNIVSLVTDSSNNAHLSIIDYYNPTGQFQSSYIKSSDSWASRTHTVASSTSSYGVQDMAIDSSNVLHLVSPVSNGAVMAYADYRTSSNWNATTTIAYDAVMASSYIGLLEPRIDLTAGGNPRIVYQQRQFNAGATNIGFLSYNPSSSGNLISNAYNANDSTNVIGGLSWTEDASLPSGTTVTVSLRTASTEGGLTGAWSDFTNATTNCSKSSGVVTCTLAAIPAGLKDGSGDQWFQYKVAMTSTNSNAPTVTNVTVTYVVNAAPEISGSGVVVSQNANNGFVNITYGARDSDASTDTDGVVTPSFEYSLNNGDSWSNVLGHITESGYASATSTRALQNTTWTTSTVLWNARETISGQSVSQAKIRVTINDGEIANSTLTSSSAAFVLDVKTPTLASPSIKVVATTTPATITNYATDDNSMQMIASLNSDVSGASWEAYAATKTITLATDPDTVYVRFTDAYFNTSSIQSATTPATPTNVVIRDLSNADTSEYSEFIAWSTVALPTPGFSRYDIYRSTNGTDYSFLASSTVRTTNYYLDQSLSANTTYYYKVATVDSNGNASSFSSVVSDNADGQGGTDTTEPTITTNSVTATSITTQSMAITWDTDEISSSSVSYVTTSFATRPFTTSTVNTMVKSASSNLGGHSVSLTGLTPNTTYFFYVASADPAGNVGYNNNSGSGFSAATLDGPTISNTTASNVTTNQATVTWTTNSSSNSTVYYSTSATLSGASNSTSASLVTSHSISLTGLTANTRYYFYVTSGNATDNNGGEYYTFVTANDSTGPVISSLTAVNRADTTAVITWTTDEAATSQVRYGTTSGNLSSYSSLSTNKNLNHSVFLSGLTANTTYYYTASSLDVTNNATTSTESNFATLNTLTEYTADTTAPTITANSISVSPIFDVSAVVTWTTNEAASSQVYYGTSSNGQNTYSTRLSQGTSHVSTLTGLTANTTYYIKVASVDSSGNATTSSESNFTTLQTLSEEDAVVAREAIAQAAGVVTGTAAAGGGGGFPYTPSDKISPVISNLKTTNIASESATVEWTTDEAGDSVVEYGKDETYGSAVVNLSNYLNSHLIKLSGLKPASKYSYKVSTADKSGNRAYSQNINFTTISGFEEIDTLQELSVKEVPAEGSPESIFTSLIQKTADIIRTMSGQVSVSTLESGLATQYATIKELGQLVPLPLIGGQPVVEVGASYAKIFWTTDKASNSLVAIAPDSTYRNNQEYTQIVGDAITLTENHEVLISELKPNTTYHYQVRSKTPVSDTAKSRDFIFTTKNEELEIITYKVENLSDNSALFSWTTNMPTDSKVTYIPYDQNGNLLIDSIRNVYNKNVTVVHEVKVEDMEGGLIYQVELSGEDLNGNVVSKTLATFSTSEIDAPPLISQVQTDAALLPGEKTLVQAIISWLTNEPSTSQIFYQKGFGKAEDKKELSQKTPFDSNFIKRHIIVITNFEPGSVYQFQVESTDSSGNTTRSRTYTLLTPRQKESVFQVIMNNIEDTFSWVGQVGL